MPRNARVLLEDRISYRCLSLATEITRHLAPEWKDRFGLTVISWRVMAVIGRFEPISAKEVASRTSTDAFFVSRAIEKLLEQGYVEKALDPQDRRRLSLSLTSSGRKVHREVEDMVNQFEFALLSGLPASDVKTFHRVTSALIERARHARSSGAEATAAKASSENF
jgi:DNA-binding MarR family transcriptional regulator